MTFMNIAGYESEKKNLEEICYLIKHHDEVTRIGLHLPTGVLMLGQPGVGKTALAEAIIHESGVPCVRVNHSEVTSQKSLSDLLRARFEEAARVQPSILFLDEIEKLLGSSSQKNGPEVGILLNAIQCYHKPGILLLATANLEDYIPGPLRRSGRFDRVFNIPLPSLSDRTEIIRHYLNRQTLEEPFTVDDFARLTEGLSGADIECIINEIGIRNMLDGHTAIRHLDVARAIADRMLAGVSRPAEQTDTLKITAYHEAGHLATALLLAPDIIEYATIRTQGSASGFSCTAVSIRSKNTALMRAKILLSGRCAERLFFPDDIFFGSVSDYKEMFRMINDLVTTEQCYGVEFNRLIYATIKPSNEKLRMCEQKIEEIARWCEEEAAALLSKHKPLVELLAKRLLEKYTLQKDEILEVYREYTESLADNH